MLAEKQFRIPAGAADVDYRIEDDMLGLGKERRKEGALACLAPETNRIGNVSASLAILASMCRFR
jgi:hypothetical protein